MVCGRERFRVSRHRCRVCCRARCRPIDTDRITATIEGQLRRSYSSLVINEDDHALGYKLLARKLWDNYMSRIPKDRRPAVGLRPFEDIDKEILRRLLDQVDPPATVVLTADAAAHADAERELAALGYAPDGPAIASRGAVEAGTSMVVLMGVPDAELLEAAAAAAPPHLVVLCAPVELAELRAMAGPVPIRVVALDGPQARAASREVTTRARLREILASGEFGRELATLAPLFDEFDGSEVAAAALVMAAEASRKPTPIIAAATPQTPAPREPKHEARPERSAPRSGDARRGPPGGASRGAPRGDARGAPRRDSRSDERGAPRGSPRGPAPRDRFGGERPDRPRTYGSGDERK